MYTLVWTSAFTREARKFLRQHPDLRSRFETTLRDLETDPRQPRLRLHALSGELAGYHAARITRDYRITLILRVTEREIILYDVGSHNDVYR